MSLEKVKVGDLIFTAMWGMPSTHGRQIIIYAYKIERPTNHGFHVELFGTLYGNERYWIPATDQSLFHHFAPRTRWVGHASRQFFAEQQGAIDRLIFRRKRYVERLREKIEQAQIDIDSLKAGLRVSPTRNFPLRNISYEKFLMFSHTEW